MMCIPAGERRRSGPAAVPLLVLILIVAGAAAARPAARDSVRTNLWLARALLTDLSRDILADLPSGCRTVELVSEQQDPVSELFEPILFATLHQAGIAVYSAADRDSAATPPAPGYRVRYRFEKVALSYPAEGRTFGLWRSWLDRELAISAVYKVVQLPAGRIVVSRRRVHRYDDRLPAAQRRLVESDAYSFTSADLPGGGPRVLLEQMVVLGTLVGMVVAYFANTGS